MVLLSNILKSSNKLELMVQEQKIELIQMRIEYLQAQLTIQELLKELAKHSKIKVD